MADVTISNLPIGTLQGDAVFPYSDGTNTYSARPSAIVAASSGSVLQVKYSFSTTSTYAPANSWETCPDLSASITPFYSNSKILIMANITVGQNNTGGQELLFRLCKNGSEITPKNTVGTNNGYSANSWDSSASWQTNTTSMQFLDTTISNTNTVIYTAQARTTLPSSGYTFRWNANATSNVYDSIGACSTMTLMEIAG